VTVGEATATAKARENAEGAKDAKVRNGIGGGPERVVAIDWSGRVDAAGQRRHIWAGVWTAGEGVRLEAGRTREEVAEWLIGLAGETPRMVVGIDCCFSFPAWFLREHGCATVFEFWEKCAAGLGERWLARECEEVERDERFWGKPHKRPEQFCGAGYRRMMRGTDWENKVAQGLEGGDAVRAAKMKGITPKSPFQIGGSGSVGTGSLRAMPFLLRLREAGFKVWPFEDAAVGARDRSRSPAGMTTRKASATAKADTGVLRCAQDDSEKRATASARPLVVEMYTRLMTGAVAKSNEAARKAYLKARRKEDEVYAGISRGVMKKAEGSEDAFDALVSAMEMVRHHGEFAGLKATTDAELRLEGITWRPGVA
jgi:hypothetical protein